MDTKWKKFSRSLSVRIILNCLVIVCLIIEIVLCTKIYDTEKKYNTAYTYKSADDFYGNTALQEDIINAWRGLFDYIIASNVQKKDADQAKNLEKNLENSAGNFQYQLIMKGSDGKDKTISNCANNSNNLNAFPIYNLYKGYLNGDTYITDWTNYYVDDYTEKYEKNKGYAYMDEDVTNFRWLEINSIISGLCEGNQEYSQYIAKNIVENIQVYKDAVKKCLYYFYQSNPNSNNEAITNNILKKLYSTRDKISINNFIDKISEEYGEDEEYLTYDETTGLVYSEDSGCYYYMSQNNTIECHDEISTKLYNRLIGEMNEQKKEAEKQEALTKEEKNTLTETISKAIYIGDNGLDSYAQIIIPIAAVLGTPEEYTMYVGVDKTLYQATQSVYMDQYSVIKEKADIIEKQERTYIYGIIGTLVFLGFVVLALLYVCGRKEGTEEIQFLAIDAWYTEIQVIFMTLGIILGIACMAAGVDSLNLDLFSKEELYISLITLAVTALILIELLCSIVRKIKGGILFRQSILGKIFNIGQEKLYYGKTSKHIMLFYLVVCGIWLFFEYVGMCLSVYDNEHWLLIFMQLILVFLLSATAIFLRRYLYQWEQIRHGVKRVKSGDINYQIPTNDSKELLNLFAKDINSLSEGLENAVDEMLKSEKLKTELISNVSHDIKTPLTSIITYVDLIKKEDVQPENVKEYIEVLDQKSQRLKTLTDDLFEAAKATSGVMKMDATQIDLGSLVNQAIGEFSEKLEKLDLDIRNNIEGDTLYVMADGKLTWRIMENLLGNVSKYALTGSRVYIDAKDMGNTILLTVKNISNTELNISADVLMERFTRGDQSRNTEGSGLGLNIAQSLANLQGGNFHVEIDGDLFKAILELPKAKI
ncbi:MAG: HAMP domain-containing histidine kinase [Lachnospiraceae bacterium]|nr:HAMP domain-containing histidine kinase [Lachnospiraceae bacterium]